MGDSFDRFGGISAIIVGLLSILYAIFFLIIARQAEYLGSYGSWLILAASGIFSSAAYVALYQRLRSAGEGHALWALLLGAMASFATLVHGAYEALALSASRAAAGPGEAVVRHGLSEVDPSGLAAFFVVGLVSFIFSWLIVRSNLLPKNLGYLGLFNALLLVILFFASTGGAQQLILISGGLTSVIVSPIWWIWLGTRLMQAS
jgi:hypothetical protein